MEHPLNVVATYPLTLGALVLCRAGLWSFVEKSLFVKRHVFLNGNKTKSMSSERACSLSSIGQLGAVDRVGFQEPLTDVFPLGAAFLVIGIERLEEGSEAGRGHAGLSLPLAGRGCNAEDGY